MNQDDTEHEYNLESSNNTHKNILRSTNIGTPDYWKWQYAKRKMYTNLAKRNEYGKIKNAVYEYESQIEIDMLALGIDINSRQGQIYARDNLVDKSKIMQAMLTGDSNADVSKLLSNSIEIVAAHTIAYGYYINSSFLIDETDPSFDLILDYFVQKPWGTFYSTLDKTITKLENKLFIATDEKYKITLGQHIYQNGVIHFGPKSRPWGGIDMEYYDDQLTNGKATYLSIDVLGIDADDFSIEASHEKYKIMLAEKRYNLMHDKLMSFTNGNNSIIINEYIEASRFGTHSLEYFLENKARDTLKQLNAATIKELKSIQTILNELNSLRSIINKSFKRTETGKYKKSKTNLPRTIGLFLWDCKHIKGINKIEEGLKLAENALGLKILTDDVDNVLVAVKTNRARLNLTQQCIQNNTFLQMP